MIGIYKLTSASGKCYVGSSCNIEKRLAQHRNLMVRDAHLNPKLQKAYNRYGPLTEEVLLVCREEDLITYEQACIDSFNPSYNLSRIAGRIEMTPETRAKIGAGNKGKVRTAEACAKYSAASRRRVRTAETRARTSAALKGRVFTAEHRAKLKANHRKITYTEEIRGKMSAAGKRRIFPVEHRVKLSAAAKQWWAERKGLTDAVDRSTGYDSYALSPRP